MSVMQKYQRSLTYNSSCSYHYLHSFIVAAVLGYEAEKRFLQALAATQHQKPTTLSRPLSSYIAFIVYNLGQQYSINIMYLPTSDFYEPYAVYAN